MKKHPTLPYLTLLRGLLLFWTMATSHACFGQNVGAKEISTLKKWYLTFENTKRLNPGSFKIPFNRIDVVDYRYDSSKLGYAHKDGIHKKLVVIGGVENALEDYLNDHYKSNLDSSSSKKMLIVIKKLWLEYGVTNKMLRSKSIETGSKLNNLVKNAVCLADLEIFAGSDSAFQALTRIKFDFSIEDASQNNMATLLSLPFDSVLKKVHGMDVTSIIASRATYSLNALHSAYKRRYEIPVLLKPVPSKGIFLTFEEFKRDIATYPEFTYTISKYSATLTVITNNTANTISEYWGFFDGKKLYVKPGMIPFPVSREGNTYDFFGNLRGEGKVVSKGYRLLLGPTIINYPSEFLQLYPLQVDMENGEVY